MALPGQLFYSTQIPVCLWFLTRDKRNGKGQEGTKLRDRRGKTLFIDARKLGTLIDRVHRDLTEEDVDKIAGAFHAWRGDGDGEYADVAGFLTEATTEEIAHHDFVLAPGRYVGTEEVEDDGVPFEDKMMAFSDQLREQFVSGAELEGKIKTTLKGLGYGA